MEKFVSPFQTFLGVDNLPIALGKLYVGTANTNPITNPVPVYWNAAATSAAPNPIIIKNGMIYNNNTPAVLFVTGDVSFAIVNDNGETIVTYPTMDSGLSIPISRVTVDTDLNMASHKITSLANATLETDGISLGQVRKRSAILATSVSGIGTNVISAVFDPPITNLTDGLTVLLNITGGTYNTSETVTFTPNLGIVTPKQLILDAYTHKVRIGSIDTGLKKFVYSSISDSWVYDNPTFPKRIRLGQFNAFVNSSSHVLTITNDPPNGASLLFQNDQEVSDFDPSFITFTVPYGATLGTLSGINCALAFLAIYDGSKIYPGICNASGLNFNETSLINTTAITAGALSDSIIYSTVNLTGGSFRVLGIIDTTQSVAGQWDTGVSAKPFYNSEPYPKFGNSTAWTTPIPAAGVQLSASHGMLSTPFKVSLEFKCLTAENGYSIGDIVEVNHVGASLALGIYKTSTTVGALTPAGTDFQLRNKTTGASFTPTKANWAYRFLLTQ